MSGEQVHCPLFYKFRTSKDLEMLRLPRYMTHYSEGAKRNTHIPHIAFFNEEKWHKMSPKDDFGPFRGGGHFWRVTPKSHLVST